MLFLKIVSTFNVVGLRFCLAAAIHSALIASIIAQAFLLGCFIRFLINSQFAIASASIALPAIRTLYGPRGPRFEGGAFANCAGNSVLRF
jgi:hypothetical protein